MLDKTFRLRLNPSGTSGTKAAVSSAPVDVAPSLGTLALWEQYGPERSDGRLRNPETLEGHLSFTDIAWICWKALNDSDPFDEFCARIVSFEKVGVKAVDVDPKVSADASPGSAA